jgi:glutamate/tyrosine decarboxylase-like PLP-dependent enzyme
MTFDLLETFRELAASFLAQAQAQPVKTPRTPIELGDSLDLELGPDGQPLQEVLATLRRVLEETPLVTSPRFFRLLFSGRDDLATLGDLLTSLTNTPMHTFGAAGPHVLIEQAAIRRLLELVGFEAGEGTLTAGGSLSNFLAVVLARNEVSSSREAGLAGEPQLTGYASTEAHYSISSAFANAGLGRRNLRRIPTDERGRVDVDTLHRTMIRDRDDGNRPALVVATSGTTLGGAFDPLAELAQVAAEHEAWLHVDAALGAPVLFSNRHRHLLAGCQKADSITWDAHKMMSVPLTCSALLVRREGVLASSLSEPAEYLFDSEWPEFDPGTRSLQCGRRNDALKLWLAWKRLGDRGYADRVDRFFALAQYAAAKIEAEPGFRLLAPPESIIVRFEVEHKSSAQICDRLAAEGRLAIGSAKVGGRRFIRLVCVNPAIDKEDIDLVLDEIRTVADRLPTQSDRVA